MAAASTHLEPEPPAAYAQHMSHSQHERDEAQRREALRDARTVCTSGDTFASSALARTARRAGDHFAAKDAAGEDRDRAVGTAHRAGLEPRGPVALAIYLYFTYFAK